MTTHPTYLVAKEGRHFDSAFPYVFRKPLKDFVMKTAEEAKIPLQLSQVARGGTDAGRIHLNRVGCPSVVISVPTRHIHSHVGLLSLDDTENTVKLVVELVKRLDQKTVESFTAI